MIPNVIEHGRKRVVGVNDITNSTTCTNNGMCYTAGTTIGTVASNLHVSITRAGIHIAGIGPNLIRAGFSGIHFRKSGRHTTDICRNVRPLGNSSVTSITFCTTDTPRRIRVTRILILTARRTGKAIVRHSWSFLDGFHAPSKHTRLACCVV